jgi:hypothetical protein
VSWRNHAIGGVALVIVGLLALGAVALVTQGSVRDHLKERYTLVSTTDGGRSAVYSAEAGPSAVAASIASAWKPADRRSDPSGFFLRYRDDIVAVTPGPDGGSRIHIDPERRAYARWYPYVGGYWGTYSGPGESFRGGGPGAGK